MRRLAAFGMLAAFGGTPTDAAKAAHPPPHHQAARHDAARPKPAALKAPAESNLVVRGRRFRPAPMPNQEIHDPAEAVRDPSTGAAIGRFGGAYIDANPVPPVNPGLAGAQSPVEVGIRH